MTFISTTLSFFPTFIILTAGASFFFLCYSPGLFSVFAVIFSLYGIAPLAHLIHERFYPLKEGISYLGDKYSPWWGSHKIQAIYIAFPALETLLRLIPGVFSMWLRLWGAKVGKGVYWTPKLLISDRPLIEIGDRVVFGYGIEIYLHVIKPKKQDLMLYVKKVKIGSNVFLGAGSRLAPGVIVDDGIYIPITTDLYLNKKV